MEDGATGIAGGDRRSLWRLAPWLVFVVVGLVQLLASFGPLVFDDVHAVANNTAIRDLGNVPAFFVDPDLFSASDGRMYRPLVLTTLALDHAIGGGVAWVFKVDNLLTHLLTCLAVLAVVSLLGRRAGLGDERSRLAALLAALVFGLHPLQVEALGMASARSEILAALGTLVALWGWLAFGERRRPGLQCATLMAGTLGACLARETGVFAPLLVLLVEVLLPAQGQGKRWLALAVRLLPALLVIALYLVARRSFLGEATTSLRAVSTGGDPLSGGSRDLLSQALMMVVLLPKAIGLWLLPVGLSVDHDALGALRAGPVARCAGLLLLVSLGFLACRLRRSSPLVSLGVLGAGLVCSPWILIPLNVPLAEHRLYLPVFFATVPLVAWAAGLRRLRPLVYAVPLGLLATGSILRGAEWLDEERLWRSALVQNPRSFRGLAGVAEVQIARGELWAACRTLERARAIYPRYLPVAQNLCEVRVRLLERTQSRAFLARSAALVDDFVEERWKDPFARLLAARLERARYALLGRREDLRRGLAWALSCLAMVEPKRLVYRTAAEVLRRGADNTAALALLDASIERGLAGRGLRLHQAEICVEADRLDEARVILEAERSARPFDPVLLGITARYHAKRDDSQAYLAVVQILAQLGYGVGDLPKPPSLDASAKPNK